MEEWIQERIKLAEGELLTFQEQQDSCLTIEARLASPKDQGKGKVLPRQDLFFQEYDFLHW